MMRSSAKKDGRKARPLLLSFLFQCAAGVSRCQAPGRAFQTSPSHLLCAKTHRAFLSNATATWAKRHASDKPPTHSPIIPASPKIMRSLSSTAIRRIRKVFPLHPWILSFTLHLHQRITLFCLDHIILPMPLTEYWPMAFAAHCGG